MAHDRDRYERDRYDRDRFENERPDRDRGTLARTGDEVRSWFGDDEARRRRERDEGHDIRFPPLTPEQKDRWTNSKLEVFLGGEIRYRDAFPGTPVHVKYFGWKWIGGTWSPNTFVRNDEEDEMDHCGPHAPTTGASIQCAASRGRPK